MTTRPGQSKTRSPAAVSGKYCRCMNGPGRSRWTQFPMLALLGVLVMANGGCANSEDLLPTEVQSPPAPSAKATGSTISPTPLVSATPEATLDPELSGWINTATFGQPGGWEDAHSVARGRDNFVALGVRWEPINEVGYGPARQRVWISPDGRSWAEVDLAPEFEAARLVDVVPTPDGGFAALGSELGPEGREPFAAVWRSIDGQAWEKVESGLPQVLQLEKVVRGAAGYLLLAPQMANADPTLWFSHDALAWEEVEHYSQEGGYVKLDDIGAGDEGFVAFGIRQPVVGGEWERFAVASADGREWIDSPLPFGDEDPDSQPEASIAALGGDWIVALPGSSTQIWFSANGLDWEQRGSVEGNGVLQAIDGRLFLSPDAGVPYGGPGVRSSVDGRDWEELDLDGRASIGAVATGPLGPVLVGSISSGGFEASASFWLRPEE